MKPFRLGPIEIIRKYFLLDRVDFLPETRSACMQDTLIFRDKKLKTSKADHDHWRWHHPIIDHT